MLEKDKTYKTYPLDKESLEKEKEYFLDKILHFDSIKDEEYEIIISRYINYVVSRNGLTDTTFMLDSLIEKNEPDMNAFVYPETNIIWFQPRLFQKTNFKNFIDTLMTIEHECTHLADFMLQPTTYQKFVNEKGKKAEIIYDCVVPHLNIIEKNIGLIEIFSDVMYTGCSLETHARQNAITQLEKIYKTLTKAKFPKEYTKEKYQNLKTFEQILISKIEFEINAEKMKGEFLESEDFKSIKNNWKNSINNFCSQKDKALAKDFEDYFTRENPNALFGLLQMDLLTIQKDIDNLFEYWNKIPMPNCEYIIKLISLPNNKHSKKQLFDFYSRTQDLCGDEGLKEVTICANKIRYPFNTIPKKYLEKYYQDFLQDKQSLNPKNQKSKTTQTKEIKMID